ncbi:outer membrane lipoprotein carrier protein LolA [Dyadobacter flavalbus]|uniref:Outer membrane lipoprotein carrier protein LolA n=1 Tax=Dyadobacter flavalbus TaxID=2579942 RepID=A0A5M8QYN7_9BACT|nr:outer membrane lipoprotein carrier protein LolA [Dyadobacter flavalbus]KAA6441309.1 outer membrane lipoprotein carrier protein LolA [Dyadobacter flavalbus]
MKIYRLLPFLLICSGFFQLHAQHFRPAAEPDKILQELRQASETTSSVQASFSEEKYLSVLKEPERSSGVFYYKKKDKMRWEQKLPAKYVILISGDNLRIQEGGKEKKVGQAGKMAGQIKELMIGLVNGDFQQNKAFSQSCLESEDQYMIVLTPVNRRLKNIYTSVKLVFSKNTMRLKELSFFEKNGDRSIMKFQNEKINQPLNDGIFQNL